MRIRVKYLTHGLFTLVKISPNKVKGTLMQI